MLAGTTLLLAYAWFFTTYFFQINRFLIGKKNSPKQFRILLLTDLHFKVSIWPFHRRLLREIKRLRPHLILFSGDLIDETGTPGPARYFLSRLDTATPKLFIPGNHDHKNKVSRHTLRKIIERHNGQLLVNETVQVVLDGIPFTITGLDDFIEGESCFADAVRNVGKETHHLLLVHSPLQQEMVLKEVEKLNAVRTIGSRIDLQYIFAGHTHGGQVRAFNYMPAPPHHAGHYLKGWYNNSKPYLYVSKGFGTVVAPFRFGARPEITLFLYGV